jgi:hypothetical protein
MLQKNDAITGPGLGFVDVFAAGVLTKHFASGGTLIAPWGVARQPGISGNSAATF